MDEGLSIVSADVVETGIKPLDLFAPIRHGDLVRWDAGANCGHVGCLAEVTRSFLLSGYRGAVWTGFEDDHIDEREVLEYVEQVGDRVDALRTRESGSYLVVVFQDEDQMADPALAFPALNRRYGPAVTAICVTPVLRAARRADPIGLEPPVSARVAHDPILVERRMFPAVDGLRTQEVIYSGQLPRRG